MAFALAAGAQTLQPGDLMFTGYNAVEDAWAMVALVDLAPGTSVLFGTDAWSPGSGFAPGGGFERWTSDPAATIRRGTVITFSFVSDPIAMQASIGNLARAIVPGSSYLSLSQSAGTLYAYQAIDASSPTQFLTAVSNGGFATEVGSLAGTGLEAGRNALSLPAATAFAQFAASSDVQRTALEYRQLLSSPSSWGVLGADASQWPSLDAASFVLTPVSEPGGLGLLGVGGWVILVIRSARRR